MPSYALALLALCALVAVAAVRVLEGGAGAQLGEAWSDEAVAEAAPEVVLEEQTAPRAEARASPRRPAPSPSPQRRTKGAPPRTLDEGPLHEGPELTLVDPERVPPPY